MCLFLVNITRNWVLHISSALLLLVWLNFLSSCKHAVIDIDGNSYRTVIIGNQEWMAQNLRTTTYNDGTPIYNAREFFDWEVCTTGAYVWYNNAISYKDTYGALYNWYAVETGRLCPDGWRVPSSEDWEELTDYLGGQAPAAQKMKARGTEHWLSPNNKLPTKQALPLFLLV